MGILSGIPRGGQDTQFFRSLSSCIKGLHPLAFTAIHILDSKDSKTALGAMNSPEDKGVGFCTQDLRLMQNVGFCPVYEGLWAFSKKYWRFISVKLVEVIWPISENMLLWLRRMLGWSNAICPKLSISLYLDIWNPLSDNGFEGLFFVQRNILFLSPWSYFCFQVHWCQVILQPSQS